MATFYPHQDQFYWPITINEGNRVVEVVEDPGGGSQFVNTVNIKLSSNLSSETVFYATSSTDPVTGITFSGTGPSSVPVTSDNVLTGTNDKLEVAHLYSMIADLLTDNSDANGNGLTYILKSSTPSNSGQEGSGLEITTIDQNFKLKYNFGASNHLDPRYFGFSADQGNQPDSEAALTQSSPFSRWGSWYSSTSAHDKRLSVEYDQFSSGGLQRFSKNWRVSSAKKNRDIEYVGVPGLFVWPDDRASRTSQSDKGSVPSGDDNNALFHLWNKTNFGQRDIIIAHHLGPGTGNGEGSLAAGFDKSRGDEISVGRPMTQFGEIFEPQATNRNHSGEKYDLTISVSEPEESSYSFSINPYLH